MVTDPAVPLDMYMDGFGNTCTRIVAPAGGIRLTADGLIEDSGLPDPMFPHAQEHPVESLPQETLVYLLGSRYCETERLMYDAWRLFGHVTPGWARVQAVCDFAHQHIAFGYHFARPTKTASEAYAERQGVCRDYAHLAITLLRCLNIPARYCTGYLGDIGVPVSDAPMDFAGWLEAYVGGAWHTFDPRNNAAAHRQNLDRARTRCRGCRHQHRIRTEHPAAVSRLDRRSQGHRRSRRGLECNQTR